MKEQKKEGWRENVPVDVYRIISIPGTFGAILSLELSSRHLVISECLGWHGESQDDTQQYKGAEPGSQHVHCLRP